MTMCDNPACPHGDNGARNVGTPDNERPYMPPYGWTVLKGRLQGCGPHFEVEVCTVDCVTPAINAALEEERRA